MKTIVIPRSVIRWALTVGVILAVGLTAANLTLLVRELERVEQFQVQACEAQNELRASLRGTLTRSIAFRRADGSLTPRGEAFLEREIAGLADIDCRAIVPAP